MKSRYFFQCLISKNKNDNIYYVSFPDFDDCFTDGESLEEAAVNAKDVLNLVIYEYIKLGKDIPESSVKEIHPKDNEFLMYVDIWTPPILDRVKNTSVKKTLTIPKWLNDKAEKHNLNYSKLLQSSIKDYLGIQ